MIDQNVELYLLIIKELDEFVAKSGTQKAAADKLGISLQYLHDVINGRRFPGNKITTGLGYKRVITYIKIED